MCWLRCLSSYQSIAAFSGRLRRVPNRIQKRRITNAGMDAFLNFERRLRNEKEKTNDKEIDSKVVPTSTDLTPPEKPSEDECCGRDCPNCVFLVYQEKLFEYENSIRKLRNPKSMVENRLQPATKCQIAYLDSNQLTAQQQQWIHENQATEFPVVKNQLIAPDHPSQDNWIRSVRHIEFALNECQKQLLTNQCALNFAIYVPNSSQQVDRLLTILKVDGNQLFQATRNASVQKFNPRSFKNTKKRVIPKPFEHVATIREALSWTFDLDSTPSTSFLNGLAAFCTDPKEIERLSQSDATQQLQDHRYGSIVEVMESLSSLSLDFASLYQIAPFNPPRYYTISSSLEFDPNNISITLGYRYRTGLARGRCCSCYLSAMKVMDNVRGAMYQSLFKYPDTNQPIIMVGAGTGIAPFRALLQRLRVEKFKKNHSRPTHLFYGCYGVIDFLYREEIEDAYATGVLSTLHVAYSQASSTPQGSYVQDKLLAQKTLVRDHLLHNKGLLYVCGSRVLGDYVRQTLETILDPQKPNILQELMHRNQVIFETW
uniref:NADPH--hemoprotein reductase n=1 Tax=Albugo laibachii Nc14 TaxID=890382 RepID=F0W4R7_9STRA|nr:conserved hypothetical protein [Albugo laibachii Nc14]|eukprot:CCA16102.1 conserved hypothetical protein [Albugo laibachii Nc14]